LCLSAFTAIAPDARAQSGPVGCGTDDPNPTFDFPVNDDEFVLFGSVPDSAMIEVTVPDEIQAGPYDVSIVTYDDHVNSPWRVQSWERVYVTVDGSRTPTASPDLPEDLDWQGAEAYAEDDGDISTVPDEVLDDPGADIGGITVADATNEITLTHYEEINGFQGQNNAQSIHVLNVTLTCTEAPAPTTTTAPPTTMAPTTTAAPTTTTAPTTTMAPTTTEACDVEGRTHLGAEHPGCFEPCEFDETLRATNPDCVAPTTTAAPTTAAPSTITPPTSDAPEPTVASCAVDGKEDLAADDPDCTEVLGAGVDRDTTTTAVARVTTTNAPAPAPAAATPPVAVAGAAATPAIPAVTPVRSVTLPATGSSQSTNLLRLGGSLFCAGGALVLSRHWARNTEG